ncbi:MAG TPA: YggT family protein [Herpetosiphonaceae bacterium]|nr:YggT family protein [Herpetosiphonaceae bacterium]
MADLLINFLSILIPILEIAIFGRVIMSWIDPGGQYTISRIIREITEPVIGPIRRLIPAVGMFDLSPLIALLLLSVLQQVVTSVAAG